LIIILLEAAFAIDSYSSSASLLDNFSNSSSLGNRVGRLSYSLVEGFSDFASTLL